MIEQQWDYETDIVVVGSGAAAYSAAIAAKHFGAGNCIASPTVNAYWGYGLAYMHKDQLNADLLAIP